MNSTATRSRRKGSEEGVALILAITTVAILTVMLTDMHETTGTAFIFATHDEKVMGYLDRIISLEDGKVVNDEQFVHAKN